MICKVLLCSWESVTKTKQNKDDVSTLRKYFSSAFRFSTFRNEIEKFLWHISETFDVSVQNLKMIFSNALIYSLQNWIDILNSHVDNIMLNNVKCCIMLYTIFQCPFDTQHVRSHSHLQLRLRGHQPSMATLGSKDHKHQVSFVFNFELQVGILNELT